VAFKPRTNTTKTDNLEPSSLRETLRHVELHSANDKVLSGSQKSALYQTIDGLLTGLINTQGLSRANTEAIAEILGGAGFYNDGNSGVAKVIDWSIGRKHRLVLTGNVTLTLSNPVDGLEYFLLLDTGAGGFTVTWPASVLWPGGVTPVITAGAGKFDLVRLVYSISAGAYFASIEQNY